MNRRTFNHLLCSTGLSSLLSAGEMSPGTSALFDSTLGFYSKLQRTKNGLYLDSYLVEKEKSSNHQCSIAAFGVGLMALCMEHELKRNEGAAEKALETLRLLNGKQKGLQIDREKGGFFRHFFSDLNGKGNSEHSTIDTAILVAGALFCRNTFNNPRIHEEADRLWNSIDWELALATPDGSWLHMIMENGRPRPKSRTKLFSEYHLLAWLIGERQKEKGGKSSLHSLKDLPRWNHDGLLLLDDGRKKAHSSFMIQFPFYMGHSACRDHQYRQFMKAQALADERTCTQRAGKAEFWGCGAGVTPNKGYFASNFQDNPGNVVSPNIIAGFMPVLPPAQNHLLTLWEDTPRRLNTPVGELLPRFSVDHPNWKPDRIEAIDYSSMLFGLAAMHPQLGLKFFREKSRFSFNQ